MTDPANHFGKDERIKPIFQFSLALLVVIVYMLDPQLPVVILCGGKGSRLKEETEFRPKPMMLIGDKPVVWHIMKLYSHFGARKFILCLGYKMEMIVDYFLNYKNYQYPTTIRLSDGSITHHGGAGENWEVLLLPTGLDTMTGGRLLRAQNYIDTDNFFLTYGDGVADVDIEKLFQFHVAHKKIATLTAIHPPSRFGVLQEGQGDLVSDFTEKPLADREYVNGGFFVLTKQVFHYLENDQTTFEESPLRTLSKEGELVMYKHEGHWKCMDTYKDYEELNVSWEKAPFWKIWEK